MSAHNSLDIVLSCFRISWIRFSLPSHKVYSHFISVTMTNNFSLQFQVTVHHCRAAKAETSSSCSPHICSPVQRKNLAYLLAYAQVHLPVVTQFRTLCLANGAVAWIIIDLITIEIPHTQNHKPTHCEKFLNETLSPWDSRLCAVNNYHKTYNILLFCLNNLNNLNMHYLWVIKYLLQSQQQC